MILIELLLQRIDLQNKVLELFTLGRCGQRLESRQVIRCVRVCKVVSNLRMVRCTSAGFQDKDDTFIHIHREKNYEESL